MIRIYTADQRFESDNGNAKVLHTLNQGNFYHSSREAIGSLVVVNEWSGLGNSLIEIDCKSSLSTLILPIQESVIIYIKGNEYIVEVGEVALIDVSQYDFLQILPQVENDQHFVFGEFQFQEQILESNNVMIKSLPLHEHNKLSAVFKFSDIAFELYIGAFVGKNAFDLIYNEAYQNTFAKVWNGNFEVEERLLFEGDSLALADCSAIQIEHLADTGIVTIFTYGK